MPDIKEIKYFSGYHRWVDLGWYLAVNATRLSGSKEQTIARYRTMLELALERRLPDPLWSALLDAGILTGAMMLLWSKAAALESGGERARQEWDWWIERLGRL